MKQIKINILYQICNILFIVGDLFSKLPWYWSAYLYGRFMNWSSSVQSRNFEIGIWKPLSEEEFINQFGFDEEYHNLHRLEKLFNSSHKYMGLCAVAYDLDTNLKDYIHLAEAYKLYTDKKYVIYNAYYWFPAYEKRERNIIINLAKHLIINDKLV